VTAKPIYSYEVTGLKIPDIQGCRRYF